VAQGKAVGRTGFPVEKHKKNSRDKGVAESRRTLVEMAEGKEGGGDRETGLRAEPRFLERRFKVDAEVAFFKIGGRKIKENQYKPGKRIIRFYQNRRGRESRRETGQNMEGQGREAEKREAEQGCPKIPGPGFEAGPERTVFRFEEKKPGKNKTGKHIQDKAYKGAPRGKSRKRSVRPGRPYAGKEKNQKYDENFQRAPDTHFCYSITQAPCMS
jgi:hypothetical protein